MNINDFIEGICLGELSNLYLGEQGLVELSPNRKRKLLHYTNQGVKALSSRFELIKKELIIRGLDHVSLYPLRKEHSMSCGTSNIKFIDDRCTDPFDGGLIKILEVRNEVGLAFPLNDINKNESLFTPTYDTLQITHPVSGQGYSVIYQAHHPVLTLDSDGCQEFHLPPLLEEALVAFVAGKVYSSMNGEANKMTSQEHMATFEGKCLEAKGLDLAAESSVTSHHKAQERGFI